MNEDDEKVKEKWEGNAKEEEGKGYDKGDFPLVFHAPLPPPKKKSLYVGTG